jgi:tetratricopeptide (TPR) repeat protein
MQDYSASDSEALSEADTLREQAEALLTRAYETLENDDGEGALALFNRVLELQPHSQEALYAKAATLYELGEATAALVTLDQVDPEYQAQDGGVWNVKGQIYLANQDYQQALACSERAIACKPLFTCWKLKADALEGLGRKAEARTAEAECYYRWGLVLFQALVRGRGIARDQEEALRLFDRALATDPTYWPAIRERSILLAGTERADEAVAILDAVVEREPTNSTAWAARGHALFRRHRYVDALGAFEQALAIQPDDLDAGTGKGAALAMLRRLDEAQRAFEQTLKWNDGRRSAWVKRIKAFEQPLQSQGVPVAAWLNKIQAAQAIARYEEALATLQDADAGDTRFWLLHGKELGESGHFREALACLNRALEVSPDSHQALRERGHLYTRMGRYEEAAGDFQQALAVDQSAAYDWHSLAWALYKLGNYEPALRAIDRALRLASGPEIVGTKGQIFNGMKRYAEALDWLDRALAMNPADTEHLRERAFALRGLGRVEEAEEGVGNPPEVI